MMKWCCWAGLLLLCLGGCALAPIVAPQSAPTPPTRMTPEQQQAFRARCQSRGGQIDWLESRIESGRYQMGCRLPHGRSYGFGA